MISIMLRETEDGKKAYVHLTNADGTELIDVTEHYDVAEMLIEDNDGNTRGGWFISKVCEPLTEMEGLV